MTDEPAAIQASFADFRLIRSRKACQLIFEVPIEGANAALAALGGIPQPHAESWVGIARLNGVTKPEPKPKDKRKWDDLKLSMQASIRCNEKAFWEYLNERYSHLGHPVQHETEAANTVMALCRIDSRAELNNSPLAAKHWNDLDRSYQAWLKMADA
jgi:hypothetical protein